MQIFNTEKSFFPRILKKRKYDVIREKTTARGNAKSETSAVTAKDNREKQREENRAI
jgi:hypothetical protein